MLTEDNLQQLYRYSYTLACNEHDAYDLLQSSLEKYLTKTSTDKNPLGYIKRIIKNQFIDNYRHNKLIDFDEYEDTIISFEGNIDELEKMIITEDMVTTILQSLSPDEREIIYYWAYEGYTAQQISDTTKTPRGTILSKLHRIRNRLCKQFDTENNHTLEASL